MSLDLQRSVRGGSELRLQRLPNRYRDANGDANAGDHCAASRRLQIELAEPIVEANAEKFPSHAGTATG